MLGFPLGILSAAGAGGGALASDYELISSTILTGSQASVLFSNLGDWSSTYKHLQIRILMRSTTSGNATQSVLRVNGNTTGSNYASHTLQANGSTVLSQSALNFQGVAFTLRHPSASATTGAFGAGVIDILDAYSTTKNKTIRVFQGSAANENSIYLNSGLFALTNAVSSIGFTVQGDDGSYIAGSRFSIYGLKG